MQYLAAFSQLPARSILAEMLSNNSIKWSGAAVPALIPALLTAAGESAKTGRIGSVGRSMPASIFFSSNSNSGDTELIPESRRDDEEEDDDDASVAARGGGAPTNDSFFFGIAHSRTCRLVA